MHREFDQLAELGEDALRRLLKEGEPRERVWAAWALGMRMGDEARDTLQEALAGEPTPGVRRHWIVMLAGFGDLDPVVALARHDPDPYVRATACQYLTELSEDDETLRGVVRDCLGDPAPRVRRACASRLPASEKKLLRVALQDRDEGVREAAAVRWLAVAGDFPEALQRVIGREDDPRTRLRWMREWFEREGAEHLATHALERGDVPADEVLEVLAEGEVTLSWDDLRQLADDCGPAGLPAFARVVDPVSFDAVGRKWLAERVRDAVHSVRRRSTAMILLAELYEEEPDDVDDDEMRLIFQLRKAIHPFLRMADSGDSDSQQQRGELIELDRAEEVLGLATNPERKLRDALDFYIKR